MAINVNTVYTTVLSILNKEQRGYLTPDEFNKVATQVQLEVFEKLFDDYTQFLRMPKLEAEFASKVDHAYEEIQFFEKTESAQTASGANVYKQPDDLYRFGSAFYNNKITSPEIEILDKRNYTQQVLSPILQPSTNFPIATYQQDKLEVYPAFANPQVNDITFNYVRKPLDVVWAYEVGDLGQYVWSEAPGAVGPFIPTTGSQDFELSDSFQTEIILEILKYSGVIVRDPQVVQAAAQELQANEVNEKR